MVELNKKIKDVIKEIVYLIILVLLSYLIWNNFGTNTWAPIAYSYNQKNEELTLAKSKNNFNDGKTFIKVENNNDISKNYNVYLSLKTEELDKIKNSYITINTKEIPLNKVESFVKDSNTYYNIINDNIYGREENSYFISLNTQLNYNLEIEEIE